jgi:Domain of unknown function (DUF6089)
MKANIEKRISILVFILFNSSLFYAQQFKNLELGAGLGVYVYQGDLTSSRIGSFRTMRPGIHLFANKIRNSNLSYRLNLAIAGLKGDESKYSKPEYRQQRNFKFKTPLIELSGLEVWDIKGNNYNRAKGVFSPYVFGGVGISYLKIKPDWSGLNTEIFDANSEVQLGLNTDTQKKLPQLKAFIPVGVGFRYEISDRLTLTTESTYRFVFTDYLDGFSYSANPKKDDHYLSQTIGLILKLGNKNRYTCPKIKF